MAWRAIEYVSQLAMLEVGRQMMSAQSQLRHQ
jgi:hypothetical protein